MTALSLGFLQSRWAGRLRVAAVQFHSSEEMSMQYRGLAMCTQAGGVVRNSG
jgi:hypothetical protein